MGLAESSYQTLLQGVSQQIPYARLVGQVSAQLNMLSDPVTNVRRRPGIAFMGSTTWTGATVSTIKGWFTDIADSDVHVIVNSSDGSVKVLDTSLNVLAAFTSTYLTTSDISNIRAATVGDEFFLLNTSKQPTASGTTGSFDPATGGFFYVVGGSFSRAYTITVQDSGGTYTAAYTTPNGSGVSDAALATPEYIATQVSTALGAAAPGIFTVSQMGAYVFLRTTGARTNLVVNTSTGSSYMLASKNRYMVSAGNLPAQLPASGDGFICAVGSIASPQYYKYVASTTAWIECGVFGSPSGIYNMPVSITKSDGTWELRDTAFEGRLSGDDTTNESPRFLTYALSGIGTYQGRLCLLSGNRVYLSASNNPRRFYRSTVTSLVASDTIGVGSSLNSSAAYAYAVPFNKDLVLFSLDYQALVPSNNAVLTPSNATVAPTSNHTTDIHAPPVIAGRTLLYAVPRGDDFFGVYEMVPSPYTDAQYVSHDSTEHLPKYFAGYCRMAASAPTAGIAFFAPSGDKRSMVVHQYVWDGDQKAQQAWHTWTLPYEFACAYFAGGSIVVLFADNDTLVVGKIDTKVGLVTADSSRRPFLDLYVSASIVPVAGGLSYVSIPSWLQSFDPTAYNTLAVASAQGSLAGEPVGVSARAATKLTLVRSWVSGAVFLGVKFTSSLTPTPPILKDSQGNPILTSKASLLHFKVRTRNSAQFSAYVTDERIGTTTETAQGTLLWTNKLLDLGQIRTSATDVSVIPARTDMVSTLMTLTSDDTRELNIVGIEYNYKYSQRIRRF